MQWFSSDGEFAFLSVGSRPVGIIAIGQFPLGVVAIGQVARGLLVIGQAAIGLVVLGQVAVGLACVGQLVVAPAWGVGMFGVVGRGRGWVLRLLPHWQRARAPAVPLVDETDLLDGKIERGWLAVHLRNGSLVTSGGHPLLDGNPARVPAGGAVADVVAEIVANEPTDFRATARAVQLRCVDIQATLPGHFVAGGWFGDRKPEESVAATSAAVVVRAGIALALALVILFALASALLV